MAILWFAVHIFQNSVDSNGLAKRYIHLFRNRYVVSHTRLLRLDQDAHFVTTQNERQHYKYMR